MPLQIARVRNTNASVEEVLESSDIQGNILVGFNKDFEALVFLNIVDVARAKAWLRALTPHIATVDELLAHKRLYQTLNKRRKTSAFGKGATLMATTWLNIALSFPALKRLVPVNADSPDLFVDESFRKGLVADSALLGDPLDPSASGHPSQWVVGGTDSAGNDLVPDIVLIAASDRPELLDAQLQWLKSTVQDSSQAGVKIVFEQTGQARPDLPGHEHFGFKDGVSQPGIRGRLRSARGEYLTPRLIDPKRSPDQAQRFGRPGQPLIFAGEFVFGYASQDRSDPLKSVPADPHSAPSWARNGSFLVFRRLRQDVQAFADFVHSQVATLQATVPGLSEAQLGALLVGRWASGAPIMRATSADDPTLADDAVNNNNFTFVTPDPPPILLDRTIPPLQPQAAGDFLGTVCPLGAHIRKVNPRDDDTDHGGPGDTLTRRILRRGIAFGLPVRPGVTPGAADAPDAAYPNDRGLLFLAYMTSIEDQFHVLSHDWADRVDTPRAGGGHDPIIGQNGAGDRERVFHVRTDTDDVAVTVKPEWVVATGGGYFFAPSISALNSVLS